MPRINAVSFHQDPDLESICRRIRAAGFDSIEMSRPPFYDRLITPGTRQRFATWAGDQGLALYGFDCWVDVDPYTARGDTLAGFRQAVAWAADLRLGMLITHDPWAKINGARSPRQCLSATVELFQAVADDCLAAGLQLTFEPHPDTLSMDNAWAIDLIDALAAGRPAKSVGLIYDFCHYAVGQQDQAVASIDVLGARIRHLHVADSDQRTYALHLPLGDGCVDLEATFAALQRVGFDGTLTNDLFNYPLLDDGARRNAAAIAAAEQRLGLRRP